MEKDYTLVIANLRTNRENTVEELRTIRPYYGKSLEDCPRWVRLIAGLCGYHTVKEWYDAQAEYLSKIDKSIAKAQKKLKQQAS